jgi:hypothetical protein
MHSPHQNEEFSSSRLQANNIDMAGAQMERMCEIQYPTHYFNHKRSVRRELQSSYLRQIL